MAKLYFHYSTMNAGKSTVLLQASHNYVERGMQTYLLTARLDNRSGTGRIASRIGRPLFPHEEFRASASVLMQTPLRPTLTCLPGSNSACPPTPVPVSSLTKRNS